MNKIVDLKVDDIFILDLRDDVMMNYDYNLYDFINDDPIVAFYLGFNISKWFELLHGEQQYLYSKELRHIFKDISEYIPQIKYWVNKYSKEKEIDVIDLSEFIINNVIYLSSNDIIPVCLYVGLLMSKSNKQEEKLLFNVKGL